MDGPDRISQALAAARFELGLPERDYSEIRVLLRDGYCVGIAFLFEEGRAVWWLDEAEERLVVQDEQGTVLKEIHLPAGEEQPAAA
jgi:hypothetical protein